MVWVGAVVGVGVTSQVTRHTSHVTRHTSQVGSSGTRISAANSYDPNFPATGSRFAVCIFQFAVRKLHFDSPPQHNPTCRLPGAAAAAAFLS